MTPEQCRAARGWLDLSQDALAAASRVSLSTVRDFEKGRRTPIQESEDRPVRGQNPGRPARGSSDHGSKAPTTPRACRGTRGGRGPSANSVRVFRIRIASAGSHRRSRARKPPDD